MSTIIFPIPSQQSTPVVSKIITYFKDHKALSDSTAIKLSKTDLLELGWINPGLHIEKLYTFLIKTSDDTYWLSEIEVDAYYDRIAKLNKRLGTFFTIFFVLVLVLPIVAMLLGVL